MIISGERQIDYSELHTRIRKAASGFASFRGGEGTPVAMMLRNDFALFEVVAASAALGRPVVPINWHLKAAEVRYILTDSGADILICHADLLPQIRDGLPDGLTLLVVATPPEIAKAFDIPAGLTSIPNGLTDWDKWRDSQAELAEPPRRGAPMFYTSVPPACRKACGACRCAPSRSRPPSASGRSPMASSRTRIRSS